MENQKIVSFQNVSYYYNQGYEDEVCALDDVSLEVFSGDFVALAGANGSGKSTIAKLLNGLITPSKGSICTFSLSTSNDNNLFDIRKNCGVVFQNPDNQMVASIIEDDVAFGPENIGLPAQEIRERVDWALEKVGMLEHKSRTPYRLSGGQRQRVAIAGVLAIKPRLLVLDEATSMLDPQGRQEILQLIYKLHKEENISVIMITHFMEEALLANKIAIMDMGKLKHFGGKDILTQCESLQEVGLVAPAACQISHFLQQNGISLKNPVYSAQQLAEELCRLS